MKHTITFIQQHPKWKPLEDYVWRVENLLGVNAGLVVENCKSLMESIFKTIIVEVEGKSEDDLKRDDIGQLNKQIRRILELEERGYAQIIGSFSNAIAQFRNKLGEISHGKDIYTLEENRNKLFEDEINFLIAMTDNTAFFLLSYYENLYPNFSEKKKNSDYEDYKQFNEWFDKLQPTVNIVGVELSPSKVLFDNDEVAYRLHLWEYQANQLAEIFATYKHDKNIRIPD